MSEKKKEENLDDVVTVWPINDHKFVVMALPKINDRHAFYCWHKGCTAQIVTTLDEMTQLVKECQKKP